MTQRAIDGDYFYFVTTLVKNREWFFIQPDRADALGRVITKACKLKHFDLFAYCILPNHVHLLVRKRHLDRAQRALEKTRCVSKDSVRILNYVDPLIQLSATPPPQSGLSSPRTKKYTLSQLMQLCRESPISDL